MFNRLIILLFMGALHSCSKGNGNTGIVTPPPKPVDTVAPKQAQVFNRSANGYALFRIPALVKSKAGTLLLFAEARKSSASGDGGDIDLVMKRSTDGGKTWGNMIMVRDDGMNTCGNPVPVVDNETGDIHLVMTWNNDHVYVTKSTDDGLTWSAPREITADVKLPGWTWYGTGPVHGIIIREGTYKGRIVIPSYASMYENNVKYSRSFVIYSDDKGLTWKLGGITKQEKVDQAGYYQACYPTM